MNQITGNCLCGAIEFSLNESFKAFYQCHCTQCQKLTGSAFASNLFTDIDNLVWLKGQNEVTHYEHSGREFSKSFCKKCGSAIPYINKSKTSLVVPAGCLNNPPVLTLSANIFSSEEACWLKSSAKAKSFEFFPE